VNIDSLNVRKKVAKEAATLLYSGVEKEYKQAKLKAATTFGTHFLPSNSEVAAELDKIAEENEGKTRQERLIQMRAKALKMMKTLKAYTPKLVGSVWRGTAHHKSDIDIVVHHDEPNDILEILKQNNIKTAQAEWVTITKKGQKKTSFHIHLQSPTNEKIEVIIRGQEEFQREEKCEIYGDKVTGLDTGELEKILKENPTQRFTPL